MLQKPAALFISGSGSTVDGDSVHHCDALRLGNVRPHVNLIWLIQGAVSVQLVANNADILDD